MKGGNFFIASGTHPFDDDSAGIYFINNRDVKLSYALFAFQEQCVQTHGFQKPST